MANGEARTFIATILCWCKDWKFVVATLAGLGTLAGFGVRLQIERHEVIVQVATLARNDSLRVVEYKNLSHKVDTLQNQLQATNKLLSVANESLDTLLTRAGFTAWLRQR